MSGGKPSESDQTQFLARRKKSACHVSTTPTGKGSDGGILTNANEKQSKFSTITLRGLLTRLPKPKLRPHLIYIETKHANKAQPTPVAARLSEKQHFSTSSSFSYADGQSVAAIGSNMRAHLEEGTVL